jgi:nucleoside-diphosphate-sugar epimerase
MNKHVIITGGMGFIGHNLAKYYLDNGFKVTVIDNLDSHLSHAHLTKYRIEQLNSKKLDFIQHSCSSIYTIKEKLKFNATPPRSIIHLASYPNQAEVKKDEYGATSSMNVNTLITAKLAKEFNARYVYVSSSMVYGNFTSTYQNENSVLNPTNLYGLLKLQGEEIAKLTHENTVIVRPSAVYGPGDNAARVLGKWILSAINNDTIYVDDPASLLDFTYIKDIVTGIFQADAHGIAKNAYNITRGQARSLGEAALLIKQHTSSNSTICYLDKKDSSVPQRGALDINKAKNDLGYNPRIDLIEGLLSYIQWIKNHHDIYRIL